MHMLSPHDVQTVVPYNTPKLAVNYWNTCSALSITTLAQMANSGSVQHVMER